MGKAETSVRQSSKKQKRSRGKAPEGDLKIFWYFVHNDDICHCLDEAYTNPQSSLDNIFFCRAICVIYSMIFAMCLTDAGHLLGAW